MSSALKWTIAVVVISWLVLMALGLNMEGDKPSPLATASPPAPRVAPAPADRKPSESTINPSPQNERAAKQFSVERYTASVRQLEEATARRDWYKARGMLHQLRVQLEPILASSRAPEPAIQSLRQRLATQERLIDGHYTKEARAKAIEDSAIDAAKLFAAFEANEVRANQEFKGQRLRVRGNVERIATDILNTPYVAFNTDSIFSVQAMFPKGSETVLAALNVGQRITVECRCDGKLMNVLLTGCRLAE